MQNNVVLLIFNIISTFLAVNNSLISWFESQLLRQQFLANQLEMVYVNTVLSFVLLVFFSLSDCTYLFCFHSPIVICHFISLHSTHLPIFISFHFMLYPHHLSFLMRKFRYACLGKKEVFFKRVSCARKYTFRVESFVICN